VLGFIGGGGLSFEEYSKGLAGFSFLVENGLPGYFLCTLLTAYPTRGSTPCSMKRCIIRCSFVEDYLVLHGIFCHQHIFL
jgi:hypothetical protein